MTNYDYLIIGGGMTAAAAVDGIRKVDPNGGIGMISTETDAPYNRPPLSEALWKGKPLESIWRKTENKGVGMHLGRVVKQIAPSEKRVVDDKGDGFTYEKLLLSTGGRPRRLPFGDEQIIYFRTLSDYRRLRALTESGRRFAVIGGGFIGSEIAAALAMNGKEVVIIFPERNIGVRVFPWDLSRYVSGFYKGSRYWRAKRLSLWKRAATSVGGAGRRITTLRRPGATSRRASNSTIDRPGCELPPHKSA
jgi:3-phenylpropionate/trans-cinnamate dioxygenase ferredoxin reductase component